MAQVVGEHPTGQHASQSEKTFPELHPLHPDDASGFSDRPETRADSAYAQALKTRPHHSQEIAGPVVRWNRSKISSLGLVIFLSYDYCIF